MSRFELEQADPIETREPLPMFVLHGRLVRDRELMDAKSLLRPDEAAAILRCSVRMVYYHIKVGKLNAIKATGPLRIKSESVKNLLEETLKDPDAI